MKDVNILLSNGVDVKKSLELFGDMAMYDETLNDFLNVIEDKKNALTRYKEEGNMNAYAIDVHALKTDARYLGFTRLGDIAYELEMKAKENNIMFVISNHARLMSEVDFVINVAKKYNGENVEIIETVESTNNVKDKAILIVDDSNLVANFVKKIFESEYEVIVASDGEEAIRIVNTDNTGKIKCCLLDLNMPKVDGFGVLDYFKTYNLFAKVPVSIITGNDTKEQVEQAFKYPIVDLLSKPFNERDVKRIIEKTIGLTNN